MASHSQWQTYDDYDAAVYVISIAAELADMHPQTLRSYERKGLISPSRTDGNTRRYSRRDVDRLRLIQRLTQQEGLNLAGVRAVIEMGEQLEASQRRIADLEDMVRRLAQQLKDDVAAAKRDRRYEVVPSPGSQIEPHPNLSRPRHSRGR